MIKIKVNGETREAREGMTLSDLVVDLGLKGRAVAAEVNQQLVPKREHEQKQLRDGDVVELVTLVGGG